MVQSTLSLSSPQPSCLCAVGHRRLQDRLAYPTALLKQLAPLAGNTLELNREVPRREDCRHVGWTEETVFKRPCAERGLTTPLGGTPVVADRLDPLGAGVCTRSFLYVPSSTFAGSGVFVLQPDSHHFSRSCPSPQPCGAMVFSTAPIFQKPTLVK